MCVFFSCTGSLQTIGFTVVNSNDVTVGLNGVIIFNRVLSSFGHGYNRITGIFKAEVAGVYVFFVAARGDGIFKECYIRIVKNGSRLTLGYYDGGSQETHFSDSAQVIVRLSIGDKVWVRREGIASNNCIVDNESTFMGYLLHPTIS